ncbi:MAG TPA: hypothetical protein DCE55_21485, partial [Planctomycetaceae bacterium]|nr:hypothetical protein [Planctomycetaceae bacterium]
MSCVYQATFVIVNLLSSDGLLTGGAPVQVEGIKIHRWARNPGSGARMAGAMLLAYVCTKGAAELLMQKLRGDYVLLGRFVFHSSTRFGRENHDVFGKRRPVVYLGVGSPGCPCEPLNL